MRERGVLVGTTGRAGNVLKIRPPLAFTTAEVPILADALAATLAARPERRPVDQSRSRVSDRRTPLNSAWSHLATCACGPELGARHRVASTGRAHHGVGWRHIRSPATTVPVIPPGDLHDVQLPDRTGPRMDAGIVGHEHQQIAARQLVHGDRPSDASGPVTTQPS